MNSSQAYDRLKRLSNACRTLKSRFVDQTLKTKIEDRRLIIFTKNYAKKCKAKKSFEIRKMNNFKALEKQFPEYMEKCAENYALTKEIFLFVVITNNFLYDFSVSKITMGAEINVELFVALIEFLGSYSKMCALLKTDNSPHLCSFLYLACYNYVYKDNEKDFEKMHVFLNENSNMMLRNQTLFFKTITKVISIFKIIKKKENKLKNARDYDTENFLKPEFFNKNKQKVIEDAKNMVTLEKVHENIIFCVILSIKEASDPEIIEMFRSALLQAPYTILGFGKIVKTSEILQDLSEFASQTNMKKYKSFYKEFDQATKQKYVDELYERLVYFSENIPRMNLYLNEVPYKYGVFFEVVKAVLIKMKRDIFSASVYMINQPEINTDKLKSEIFRCITIHRRLYKSGTVYSELIVNFYKNKLVSALGKLIINAYETLKSANYRHFEKLECFKNLGEALTFNKIEMQYKVVKHHLEKSIKQTSIFLDKTNNISLTQVTPIFSIGQESDSPFNSEKEMKKFIEETFKTLMEIKLSLKVIFNFTSVFEESGNLQNLIFLKFLIKEYESSLISQDSDVENLIPISRIENSDFFMNIEISKQLYSPCLYKINLCCKKFANTYMDFCDNLAYNYKLIERINYKDAKKENKKEEKDFQKPPVVSKQKKCLAYFDSLIKIIEDYSKNPVVNLYPVKIYPKNMIKMRLMKSIVKMLKDIKVRLKTQNEKQNIEGFYIFNLYKSLKNLYIYISILNKYGNLDFKENIKFCKSAILTNDKKGSFLHLYANLVIDILLDPKIEYSYAQNQFHNPSNNPEKGEENEKKIIGTFSIICLIQTVGISGLKIVGNNIFKVLKEKYSDFSRNLKKIVEINDKENITFKNFKKIENDTSELFNSAVEVGKLILFFRNLIVLTRKMLKKDQPFYSTAVEHYLQKPPPQDYSNEIKTVNYFGPFISIDFAVQRLIEKENEKLMVNGIKIIAPLFLMSVRVIMASFDPKEKTLSNNVFMAFESLFWLTGCKPDSAEIHRSLLERISFYSCRMGASCFVGDVLLKKKAISNYARVLEYIQRTSPHLNMFDLERVSFEV